MYSLEISGPINQGDITRKMTAKSVFPWWPDGASFPIVILTPTCDIEQGNVDYHRVGVLQPVKLLFARLCEDAQLTDEHYSGKEFLSNKKRDTLRQRMRNLVTHNWPRYHFFPSQDGVFQTDYFLDFQLTGALPVAKLNESLRHCRLISPYQEELIHRFSHYAMRIGTPDLSPEDIERVFNEQLTTFGLKLGA